MFLLFFVTANRCVLYIVLWFKLISHERSHEKRAWNEAMRYLAKSAGFTSGPGLRLCPCWYYCFHHHIHSLLVTSVLVIFTCLDKSIFYCLLYSDCRIRHQAPPIFMDDHEFPYPDSPKVSGVYMGIPWLVISSLKKMPVIFPHRNRWFSQPCFIN